MPICKIYKKNAINIDQKTTTISALISSIFLFLSISSFGEESSWIPLEPGATDDKLGIEVIEINSNKEQTVVDLELDEDILIEEVLVIGKRKEKRINFKPQIKFLKHKQGDERSVRLIFEKYPGFEIRLKFADEKEFDMN